MNLVPKLRKQYFIEVVNGNVVTTERTVTVLAREDDETEFEIFVGGKEGD